MSWAAKRLIILSALLVPVFAWSFEVPVKVAKGSYKHFKLTEEARLKFGKSNVLKMSARHLGKEPAKLFVTFEDAQSSDYWSRLNFKTTLFPGRNELYFDLSQKVGQKGSSGGRHLDPSSLKKFYVIVDPDEEASSSFKISIDEINFQTLNAPVVPKGVYLFNFKGKDQLYDPIKNEIVIDETTDFQKKGHGFKALDFWRAEDAQIAPRRLSTSLSINSGEFVVSLPNGKYAYELIWDHMGYWDVPFWTTRKLTVNGKMSRIDGRSMVRDYLKDYLSLMNEPHFNEDLFSFYLKKKLAPVTGEMTVKNKMASFKFEGDPSGVSLNSLLIYPANKPYVKKFKKELSEFESTVFKRNYRRVGEERGSFKELSAKAISPSALMRSGGKCPKKIKASHLGVPNYEGYLNLCVELPNDSPVTYAIKGKDRDKFHIELYSFRPKSVDLNHETYIVRAEDLSPLDQPSFEPNGHGKRFLRIVKKEGLPVGKYHAEIIFEQDGKSSKVDFIFENIDAEYDLSAYRAGFLGLNPFPTTSFGGAGAQESRTHYGKAAIKELQKYGLNLFTDYPSPKVEYQGANKTLFKLNTKDFDGLVSKTKSSELLFYNGEFPTKLFTGHQRNAGQTEDSYWENMREELERLKSTHGHKKFIYLYSDEAAGYRNAIDEDMQLLKKYKKLFPKFLFGGFGDLRAWEKAKGLYGLWDYGLYSEVPSKSSFEKARNSGQDVGVYNLCAGPEENLHWCFGPQLYILKANGLNRYLEWHASGSHNYPGLDLDGREADIALFYPSMEGKLVKTSRFSKAIAGMELALKLDLLEKRCSQPSGSKKIKKLKNEINDWLTNIKAVEVFPIKNLKSKYQTQTQQISTKADLFLQQLF